MSVVPPTTCCYYSLTNIDDASVSTVSHQTRSKFDAGYASEDEQLDKRCSSSSISCLSRCRSDSMIYRRRPTALSSSYTPSFPRRRHSMSNSYDADQSDNEIDRTTSSKKRDSPVEPCWDGYQNPLFYPMDSISNWDDFDALITLPPTLDTDSDLDDFHAVMDESERQLIKARLTLERRSACSPRDEHTLDELFLTCQTNIECLSRIWRNLPRSSNARLNSTQAFEQLESYVSTWRVMRERVDEARTRARRSFQLSRDIIRFDDESTRLTKKMTSDLTDLRTFLARIDELLHLEEQLDDDEIDVDQLQTLIDTYERLIPVKSDQRCLSLSLIEHCRAKVNLYRTMLEEVQRRHLSINLNNNNSSTPPAEHFTIESRETGEHDFLFNPCSREQTSSTSEITASQQQSGTTSYISDDCKVFYIETVIEVARPVFYERTTDTHSHHFISRPSSTQRPLTNMSSHANPPHVNGIEPNHRSSSTEISDDQPRSLFPEASTPPTSKSAWRRLDEKMRPTATRRSRPSSNRWQPSLRRCCLAFLIGFLILSILFLVFLFHLDTCSRSAVILSIFQKIIRIESEGLPTF